MFARGDLENVRSPRGDAVSPLTLQRRPHAQTEDSHRGHKGQTRSRRLLKILRNGIDSEINRSKQLSYFLRNRLSDLRDLCVNLFEFSAQNRDLSVRKTILAAR